VREIRLPKERNEAPMTIESVIVHSTVTVDEKIAPTLAGSIIQLPSAISQFTEVTLVARGAGGKSYCRDYASRRPLASPRCGVYPDPGVGLSLCA
jgi:hypothetical protein